VVIEGSEAEGAGLWEGCREEGGSILRLASS